MAGPHLLPETKMPAASPRWRSSTFLASQARPAGNSADFRHAQHQPQRDQFPERARHRRGRGHQAPQHKADGQEDA